MMKGIDPLSKNTHIWTKFYIESRMTQRLTKSAQVLCPQWVQIDRASS